MDTNIENCLINKNILHPGKKFIKLTNGTKVKFHYQTKKLDGTIIDDSRTANKPMELVLGKKFKLEVWEVIVQKMAVNEVAKFTVDKSLVLQYPFISKTIRDSRKPHEDRRHCCGMTIQNEGIGYDDLNELFNKPCDLEFIIELLSVELPEEYEKDVWQLNEDEVYIRIQTLREQGNQLFKDINISKAEEKYGQAIGLVEQLMLKEKPNDVEWLDLAKLKIPLLLNYAQCKLLDKDYYTVIEHCTEVLKYEPKNVKALFRRAKANVGAWNVKEAREDFARCVDIDTNLKSTVEKELQLLNDRVKLEQLEEKLKYQRIFDDKK